MPTFKFTSPDGKTYTVNGPEGSTEKEAFQMLQTQMATPAAAPRATKPFGKDLSDSLSDIPRQIGLTARYGIEGVGNVANFVASPVRAGLNAVLPKSAEIRPMNFEGIADTVGLPVPRTDKERVVGDATRALAGAIIPIAAGASVAKNTVGTAQTVGRFLAANPASQLVSAGSAGAASGATRETGGGEGAQLAASLGAGLAAPFALSKVQGLNDLAMRTIRNRTPLTQQQLDIQINQSLQPSGSTAGGPTLADFPVAVQNSLRKDVADALKISGTLSPDAVRRLADYRLIGARPTAGPLSQDVAIITQQKNLAKQGVNSKDVAAQELGQTENQNNKVLIEGMNRLGASTKDAPIAGARRVTDALDARDARANKLIGDRYDLARASNGRSAELDPDEFVSRANAKLNEALLAGKVPSDVRNILNKEWVNVMRGVGQTPGQNPQRFTVDMAEQMKTRIGDLQRASVDASERKALGLVRSALDDTPLMSGQQIGQDSIDAFNKARSLNRAYMKIVERTPALEAVRDGVEPDKFVQTFIVGSGGKANVADVKALYGSIKSSPDAVSAVREQITRHLKKQALNGANDEVGNVSQSAYNKSLESIGDEKLALFFKPAEIAEMKAIGRVASYEQVQPRGSAVNNSNTASAGMAAILDRIGNSPLLSKIPLGSALSQPVQNISVGIQSRQTMNVPQIIAGNRLTRPSTFAVSPLIAAPDLDNRNNKLAQPKR